MRYNIAVMYTAVQGFIHLGGSVTNNSLPCMFSSLDICSINFVKKVLPVDESVLWKFKVFDIIK